MLEIKNTSTEIIKNDFDISISRQDMVELRDITTKISKTEKQRVKKANERKKGREEGNIQELCDNYKGTAYV